MPVFAHLEGICHVYVDRAADLDNGEAIVLNAKMRRTGVCGAAETLLVDRAGAATHLKPLVDDADRRRLRGARRRRRAARRCQRVKPATEEDWDTEYRDAIISAKVVDGVDEAIAHIHTPRLAAHRRDRHRGRRDRRAIPRRGRFGDRAAQRLDAVRRRRRVRLRRRDRHRHRQISCARPGRRRAADQLQISRPRHRADARREAARGGRVE